MKLYSQGAGGAGGGSARARRGRRVARAARRPAADNLGRALRGRSGLLRRR